MAHSVNATSLPRGGSALPDTFAVLRASQALSSERTAARLWERVEAVLCSIAGASKVMLAVWDEEANDWVLPVGDSKGLNRTAAAQHAPLSVVRHAQLTAETVHLVDATTDPRFAADPFFAGMQRCAVLAVPIQRRGAARAMLVMANRGDHGGFSPSQLEAVKIVADQLAAALDNARLFERLEDKVTEQSQQLQETQLRLVAEARRAGMAQIATNVLHNVGNVLTSVNVSAHVLAKQVQHSPASRVGAVAQLLDEQAGDLATFFGPGGRGQMLPGYLRELADALGTERKQLLAELQRLRESIEHIKSVIAMQQSYAVGRVMELAQLGTVVDDALGIQESSMQRHAIQVRRHYEPVREVPLDKARVMEVLVNLLENARQAMDAVTGEKILEVSVRQDKSHLEVSVRDNGCGISAENLKQLFTRGFTTKAAGHGIGLHSCATAAQEMGGSLTAHSDGPGKGATFVLRLLAP